MSRFVAAWTSTVKRTIRRALPHLKPVIDERKAKIQEHGLGEDWPGKPVSRDFQVFARFILGLTMCQTIANQSDMLQWVIEQAIPRGASDESIAARILLVNFAAIHTSSTVCPSRCHSYAPPRFGIDDVQHRACRMCSTT